MERSHSTTSMGNQEPRAAGHARRGEDARGTARRSSRRRLWHWSVASYLLLSACGFLFWIYFHLLNRTTVVRHTAFEIRRNTLFVSNHQSSVDSFLIAVCALFPRPIRCLWMLPWNLATADYFFRTPLRAWFSSRLRCIPARGGVDDGWGLRRFMTELTSGVGIFFPEGKRSPDGAIQPAGPGLGLLVLTIQPQVIPVAIHGMTEAVRFDRFGLRFFRRIEIVLGEPIDFALERRPSGPVDREQAQRVTDEIMARVRRLHDERRASRVGA